MAISDIRSGRDVIGRSWLWWVVGGVVSILGGIYAFANPVVASFSVVILAGAFFLVLGVLEVIAAIQMRGHDGFWWKLLLGLATAAVGVFLLAKPFPGMVALTLAVAAGFGAMGLAKLLFAFRMRPRRGWGWMLLSGLVSLILVAMILSDFPASAVTILGVLLAVELLFNGIALLFAGLELRRLAR